jgi:hypothetical protein
MLVMISQFAWDRKVIPPHLNGPFWGGNGGVWGRFQPIADLDERRSELRLWNPYRRMLQHAYFGSKGGFQTFAAVANQPPGKDGSGHSKRVKIEDFSAVPQVGFEPKPDMRSRCND